MSGTILDLSATALPAERTVDVLVIGSGPGGATAARALARKGKQVLVLEEGPDKTGAQLTQRDTQMYDQLYIERGGRLSVDMSVTVLQGRALGGGSVINACDVVPLEDDVLEHWRVTHGLADFTAEALAPHKEIAFEDLGATRPDDALINRNNQLLRLGAEKLGWKGEHMLHNRLGCAGLGKCLIGCPLNAKRNARFVALPAAMAAGAEVMVRARVVRIEAATSELKRVHVRALDAAGHHEGGAFVLSARTVIVAANAVGSAALLLRSGLGNDQVGRNLMLQPQLPITAFFDEPVTGFRGIPQSYAVTEFEERPTAKRGLSGFRIEAIGGTPGIVASLLPALGSEGQAWMAQFGLMAAALLLAPDEPSGRVEVESSGRIRVHYSLSLEQKLRFLRAAKSAAQAYFAAGARQVIIPTVPPVKLGRDDSLAALELDLRPACAPLLSAHQQGSVRFAASAERGGADPSGQVYGTRGVFVFDSSGYPSSASSHTMAPIIATSSFLAERLS